MGGTREIVIRSFPDRKVAKARHGVAGVRSSERWGLSSTSDAGGTDAGSGRKIAPSLGTNRCQATGAGPTA
jgi:hypothetical protein